MNESLEKAIIEQYRNQLNERYQLENLAKNRELPPDFPPEKINELRHFFLDYIYPEWDTRQKLNAIFEHLDRYVLQPKKVLKILSGMRGLFFKYGTQLPKLFRAGLNALQSFRVASEFEKKLIAAAEKQGIQPPIGEAELNDLIRQLNRKDVDHFLEITQKLFEQLYDQKLMNIFEEMMAKLAAIEPDGTITPEEAEAFQLGYELVKKGNELFGDLTPTQQRQVIEFVTDVEREEIERVFGEK